MFTLAMLCIFLLYLWLPSKHYFITAFADDAGNGSTIAGVNVNGLDQKEIENVLTDAVDKWTKEDIKVIGGGIEILVDPSKLQFDIQATISEYRTLVDKPWYAFWESERIVHIPLKVSASEEIKNEVAMITAWETDETYNQLISQVSFLMDHVVEAKVKDLTLYDQERLALTIIEIPSNTFAPDQLISTLDGMMINPGEEFSFIEAVNENISRVNSESLTFVASLLYDAVLQTEFEIIERHHSNEIHTAIELGKEASINVPFNEDFKFRNNSDYVGKLHASIDGNAMRLEITSNVKGKEVFVDVDKQILSPRIIYRYSADLPVGYKQLIQEGSVGYRVMVTRTISGNGSREAQQISRDYYPPVNEIILKSSNVPKENVTGTDTPNTPDTNDENMEIDLDGDGLPDVEVPNDDYDEETTPQYDKGGNKVTP